MSKEQARAYLHSDRFISDLEKSATEAGYEVSMDDIKEVVGGFTSLLPDGEEDRLIRGDEGDRLFKSPEGDRLIRGEEGDRLVRGDEGDRLIRGTEGSTVADGTWKEKN